MRLKNLLITFIRERRWSYIFGILILFGTSLLAMMVPKIIGIITDAFAAHDTNSREIIRWILIMIGVVIAVFCLKFCWRYLLVGNSRAVECYLRDHLFAHLQKLSLSYYNTHKTGELIAYAINDVQAIRMIFGPGFLQALDGIVISVLALLFMSGTINIFMALLMVVPIPPAVVLMIWLSKIIRKRYHTVQKSYADISDKAQENLSGIRVIKAFSQENEEVCNFQVFNTARFNAQMSLTKVSALVTPAVQCCFGVGFFFFITLGSALVKAGTISIGDFVAFNMYSLIILGPVSHVTKVIDFWQRGRASAKRLDDLLSIEHEYEVSEGPVDRVLNGSIVIRNLSFSYPGTSVQVVKNCSITLNAGKTLGILGRTGSGKSTLANLLVRLFPVEKGQIYIDGEDINTILVEVIRENIGYVPQDNFLFSTTIKDNIGFFRNCYTDETIENAARCAEVYDTIMSFPDAFETVIGERGVTLSGGQKQRIAIARALVKNSPIMILDDSLSAVDGRTEQMILRNIREALKNRTGIIISHRVASVKNADMIVVLEKGEIVEQGTHSELIVKNGAYKGLWISQHGDPENVSKAPNSLKISKGSLRNKLNN